MKKSLQIETLRAFIRKELTSLIKEQQSSAKVVKEPDQQAPPTKSQPIPVSKPKAKKAEPKPVSEPVNDVAITELTSNYIRKVRMMADQLEQEDLVTMLSSILTSMVEPSEHRLEVLKGVRNRTIR